MTARLGASSQASSESAPKQRKPTSTFSCTLSRTTCRAQAFLCSIQPASNFYGCRGIYLYGSRRSWRRTVRPRAISLRLPSLRPFQAPRLRPTTSTGTSALTQPKEHSSIHRTLIRFDLVMLEAPAKQMKKGQNPIHISDHCMHART